MSRCDLKVVLLGCEHVGKTSLVMRFVNSRFNDKTLNTIGAAFCAKQMSAGGREFLVGIWDTAGSERYEAMTRLYYRGAQAAVLCYEPYTPHSWVRLRHWLNELRNVEEECRVYLCATKKDITDAYKQDSIPHERVREDTVESYARDLAGHFHTSSKTGEGVDELFQRIVEDCAADQQLRRRLSEERRAREIVTPPGGNKRAPCAC